MSVHQPSSSTPSRRVYVPAVGPRLRRLLVVVLGLFSLLAVNAAYLLVIRIAGWWAGESYENLFFLFMFLAHLALGALLVLPLVVFGALHIRSASGRPNRRAVRVGYALFGCSLLLVASGVVLTRIEGLIVVQDPVVRSAAWWIHALSPLFCAWLYVLHRLAGRRIRWKVGLRWAAVAAVFAGLMLVFQARDPRPWNQVGNPEGALYFDPSPARTVSGDFIPARILDNDEYCQRCHADVHESWMASAHRLSSFNNPSYLASVRETRAFVMERDGDVKASRFCAGCHDVVPLFSGSFSDPDYDMVNDPTAKAGITCTACHAISKINSPVGNGDYTIDVPIHYPFTFSDNPVLRWVNEQLVKAKPEFHKQTFLKPLHRSTEFCGSCHKVHLPAELNGYKWLRGQSHQDSFWLSGVSGQGVKSFYYPEKAEANCNGCHMELIESEDFSAQIRDDSGKRKTFDHQFPSANTAVPVLVVEDGLLSAEQAARATEGHRRFNQGVMRVDLFGIKEGGRIDGVLTAPLRPELPALRPGGTYLIEAVIRTLKMGHLCTEGTADSNQAWLEVVARSSGRVIGRSGGMDEAGVVDPWSHFVNSFVLDRDGNRINRRNPQDVFTTLYNHQIPPGAADVVHFRLQVPPDLVEPLTVEVRLRYRKFDTEYLRFVKGDPEWVNDMPVLELAVDSITFPIGDGNARSGDRGIEPWERWNDYGIGLLRKGGRGELRQAAAAFERVEELGRPDGPLNLARVYLREGLVTEQAPAALRRARGFEPPGLEWTLLWLTGQVNQQNGRFDQAIENYEQLLASGFEQARGSGFDFSKDYELLVELGSVLYQRGRQERGESRKQAREAFLRRAAASHEMALVHDPENVAAHYGLKLVYRELGDSARSANHAALHERYKPDDNAGDRAAARARLRYPAANHAAEGVVIYDLQREGAFGLPAEETHR